MKKFIFSLLFSLTCMYSLPALALEDVKTPQKEQTMSQQVNINTATEKELTVLPGIGKSKAKAIVEYRTKNGKFQTVDDLVKVEGIGKKVAKSLDGKVQL